MFTAIKAEAQAPGSSTAAPVPEERKGGASRKYVQVAIVAASKAKEGSAELIGILDRIEKSTSRDERAKLLREAKQKLDEVRGHADQARSANSRALKFLSSAFDLQRLEEASKKASDARDRARERRAEVTDSEKALRAKIDQTTSKREEMYSAMSAGRGQAGFQALRAEVEKIEEEVDVLREQLDERIVAAEAAEEQAEALEQSALRLRTTVMDEIAEEVRLSDQVRDALEEAQSAEQDAEAAHTKASRVVDEKEREDTADEALCGANATQTASQSTCFFYGLFTASLSRVTIAGEDGTGTGNPYWGGRSARQIGAVAVPTAGARYVPPVLPYISIDAGVFSSFVSPKLQSNEPTSTASPAETCSEKDGEFEARLPCQGNAALNPYAVGYLGVTIGRKNLGFATIMPLTFGLGSLGESRSLKSFYGWTLGVVQINGTLP